MSKPMTFGLKMNPSMHVMRWANKNLPIAKQGSAFLSKLSNRTVGSLYGQRFNLYGSEALDWLGGSSTKQHRRNVS